ncbi:CPBP family intramembrane glutamic endopeptidase [Maribellus sp. YY47]|uniref:CPBP family intramembrane glutamic endopeptidase n=1 Tax=Maribellus sp. YY47 TaxID=2929486 RepID=UPI002000F908|nr:CPBP family intramembrane glutamic endopeptidase [Maribellus sp. YY47]MCK3684932.1 CPBP family intramembrane metalloprotease [Maribellus sp. YY47]
MSNSTETDKQRGFEIAAVVATGLLKHVFMDWLNLRAFYIGVACIFWSVYIYKRYRKNRQILQHWGFRRNNFKQSFLFLTPFALLMSAAIVWYGLTHNAVFLNWHVIPVFIFYPVWGLIQQFLMLSLIAGNLVSISTIKRSKTQIILLTSALFALVHYPSLPLMVFAFLMELVFAFAFFKWRNLWALALYHGWVASLLLFFVLGRDLWNELWTVL